MDVYHALYPIKGYPDALELETFDLQLQDVYGVDLSEWWQPDLTLGDVFGRITHTPH